MCLRQMVIGWLELKKTMKYLEQVFHHFVLTLSLSQDLWKLNLSKTIKMEKSGGSLSQMYLWCFGIIPIVLPMSPKAYGGGPGMLGAKITDRGVVRC